LGGASFDSLLGRACAISIGAVCACEGMLANCAAVRAVVASSTRRRFVMMRLSPRKNPEQQTRCLLTERIGTAINR
jgi:hypothetical protein